MYKERKRPIKRESLEELSVQISSGLNEMIQLSSNLEKYDKDTIILFVVLLVEAGQNNDVLEIMDSLQGLTAAAKKG